MVRFARWQIVSSMPISQSTSEIFWRMLSVWVTQAKLSMVLWQDSITDILTWNWIAKFHFLSAVNWVFMALVVRQFLSACQHDSKELFHLRFFIRSFYFDAIWQFLDFLLVGFCSFGCWSCVSLAVTVVQKSSSAVILYPL